jgi:hypothetical protein
MLRMEHNVLIIQVLEKNLDELSTKEAGKRGVSNRDSIPHSVAPV